VVPFGYSSRLGSLGMLSSTHSTKVLHREKASCYCGVASQGDIAKNIFARIDAPLVAHTAGRAIFPSDEA